MRRLAIGIVIAITLLTSASTALADGPQRVSDGPPPTLTDTTCGYLINVQFVVNREIATTWTDTSGLPIRTIVTGSLKVMMTNPANGKSATLNISGPAIITYSADGTSTQLQFGRSVVIDTVAGQLSLNSGKVIESMPSGAVLSLTGRSLNLCDALR
jgi:hypothetical protein